MRVANTSSRFAADQYGRTAAYYAAAMYRRVAHSSRWLTHLTFLR
jgi:hypothetical protein